MRPGFNIIYLPDRSGIDVITQCLSIKKIRVSNSLFVFHVLPLTSISPIQNCDGQIGQIIADVTNL